MLFRIVKKSPLVELQSTAKNTHDNNYARSCTGQCADTARERGNVDDASGQPRKHHDRGSLSGHRLGSIAGFTSDAAGDESNLFSDGWLGYDAGRDDVANVDRTAPAYPRSQLQAPAPSVGYLFCGRLCCDLDGGGRRADRSNAYAENACAAIISAGCGGGDYCFGVAVFALEAALP